MGDVRGLCCHYDTSVSIDRECVVMNLLAAIAIVNSQWAVPAVDANEVDRDQRLYSISVAESRAVEHATCSGEWASVEKCRPIFGDANLAAAFVTVKAKSETDLRKNVHADECKRWECDPKKWRAGGVVQVAPQARSLWQMHRPKTWSDERWEGISGLSQEATDNAAWEAMKMLAGAYGVCGTIEGALTRFATGNTCHAVRDTKLQKSMVQRAALVVSVRNRLVMLMATEAKGVAER